MKDVKHTYLYAGYLGFQYAENWKSWFPNAQKGDRIWCTDLGDLVFDGIKFIREAEYTPKEG